MYLWVLFQDSRNVIGIDLDLRKLETELKIIEGVFKRMSNNQFVRIKNSFHSIDPVTCLPSNPRILHWHFFPMTCLPSNINLEFLVEIILIESNFLEKLWEGNKVSKNNICTLYYVFYSNLLFVLCTCTSAENMMFIFFLTERLLLLMFFFFF